MPVSLTRLSAAEYDNILYGQMTPSMAVRYLREGRIPLADAVILVATAPKSNTGEAAIDAAMADLQKGRSGPIPRQLQNKHFDGEDAAVKGQHYKYPHAYPGGWVAQQYLPDALAGTQYYHWGENKTEQAAKAYWQRVKGQFGNGGEG